MNRKDCTINAKMTKENKIKPAIHGVAFGAMSGITSVTAAFPFELIRRRLQVQGVPDPMTGACFDLYIYILYVCMTEYFTN